MPNAAVITVSDSCWRGERADGTGPAVQKMLEASGYEIAASEIVPDEIDQIRAALLKYSRKAALIITAGGTGIAARDVTPEATRSVCNRLVEGIAERMRAEGVKNTPLAALSRGVCGICGEAMVVNLPGSPKAATESLSAVLDILPHALELLRGHTLHTEASHPK